MNQPAPSHLFYQTRLRRPLLQRAKGVHLWDIDGKRYLDGSSGAMVCNIGHANPRVLKAMQQQMERATFAYRLHFENDASEQLATQCAALMPEGLDQLFFVSGGSEAVESALKLARQYALAIGQPQRYKFISRFPSYHGATLGALGLTGHTPMTAPFAPMLHESAKIPAPTCYLDTDDLSDHDRGLRYADMLEAEILRQGPETILGFVVEPVGGAATGALVAPDSYLPRIREICSRYGVLLILDEVMTGGGRTGTFLASEHWNVVPDIVVLSKGFAAGYMPLGGMAARQEIVRAVLDEGGFIHGFTYAGNPLACAAGLAVLEELQGIHTGKNLMHQARFIGHQLKTRLQALMDDYPAIGDVRGKGLLLAFELVRDRHSMQPLPTELNAHQRLVDIAYEEGLIIYSRRTRGGYSGDHFMVCPPLISDEEILDELMGKLRRSLDRFFRET